jgi:two-component system, response regulator, stage 0 sporulation protein A
MNNLKIILADSNFEHAQYLIAMLNSFGLKHITHLSNFDLLNKFLKTKEKIDILIIDSNLYNLKIIDFIKVNLKNNSNINNTILTTGIIRNEFLVYFYNNGIDLIINHPIKKNELKMAFDILYDRNLSYQQDKAYRPRRIKEVKDEVRLLLNDVNLKIDLLGYQYLSTAVELVYKDYRIGQAATKWLYPEIATLHQTTFIRVERAIRNCISECVKTNSLKCIARKLNIKTRSKRSISNLEFIFGLVEILRTKV